jgi:hypothetical protein
MAHGDAVFFLSRVVNDGNEPVTVLTNIEDHVAIHIIRIFENLTHFHEIPPSRISSDPVPGTDFSGCVRKSLFGPQQMLARDNVHGPLSVAALACIRRGTAHSQYTLQNAKLSRKT